jgi:serine-type D-Ala-D-Ala carboxypeptidase (penicillin-binding protein 5/6)
VRPRSAGLGGQAFGSPRGGRRKMRVAAVAVVVVIAAIGWLAVQLLRPVPTLALAAAATTARVMPGLAPRPDWPTQGEAAIGLPGTGLLSTHGGSQPVPIASLAKIMTAYLVLRTHPLTAGEAGPVITVSAADAATYASDERAGQSVVKVVPGERLTELQALEAMLIPSGNNIASMLAAWDAGSVTAFVAEMNAEARALGLGGTHYADASGADPATVSTASGQFQLTVLALRIPAFRQIVAMPQVTLPVAGIAYNVNASLGHDGIVGVKTGSSDEAGGCLSFAALRLAGGRQVTIVGVVLGVHATAAQPSELAGVIAAAERLLASVGGHLTELAVVQPGAVLGTVTSAWGATVAAVAATGVTLTDWTGAQVTVTITARPLAHAISAGQPVAEATVRAGTSVSRVTLDASQDARPPPLSWLLTRL